jgi:hypothetical protein
VDCYLYQTSGDPDEFEHTLTFGVMYWLHAAAAMRLPGYEESPWPVSGRDVFTRAPDDDSPRAQD